MRFLIGVLLGLGLILGGWLAFRARSRPEPLSPPAAPASPASSTARASELEAKVDRLSSEIGRLQAELALLRTEPRSAVGDAPPVAAPSAGAPGAPTPLWYLEQYERSFDGGGTGSEYFRLAVEAYAPDLIEPIGARLRDARRTWLLRERLCKCLGTPRLARNGRAIDALLTAVRGSAEPAVVATALNALAMIGDLDTARALERQVWQLPWEPARRQAIDVIVALAEAQANACLLRLMHAAPDDPSLVALIARLDPSELDDSLEAFRFASRESQPVRLAAALRIGDFRSDSFERFVDEWAAVERDPEVLAALGRAREEQRELRNWCAAQATGAPDADPARDDAKAWASRQGDMGVQWLELAYARPMRADRVRIFEVNRAGAVVEVIGIDAGGREQSLWKGEDPTAAGGVFELEFPTTKFEVARLRIVLDTDRTPGWNEIDAVELLGPAGRAWAERARASSEYGR